MYIEKKGISDKGNICELIADVVDDMLTIPGIYPMGSRCRVIATGGDYILNSNKEWILQPQKGKERINSIADLKLTSPEIGATLNTAGFYSAGDGGGASYTVEETGTADDIAVFALANGTFAKLNVNSVMNVLQFGAVPVDVSNGDINAINVDSQPAIQAAIDSGLSVLNFPKTKHFLQKAVINVEVSNLTLNGNGSTLLTNNLFPDSASETRAVMIRDASNIVYDNLNMRAAQTRKVTNLRYQLQVMAATDVLIKNSEFWGVGPKPVKKTADNVLAGNYRDIFTTPEFLALDTDHDFSNIDLLGDYNNVTVENCDMYLMHDGPIGLCYMARDIWGEGSGTNAILRNCYMEKVCHDEIIAVGMPNSKLENITIENNTMIMYDGPRTSSTLGITLGTVTTALPTKNIVFKNNDCFVQADRACFAINGIDADTGIVFSDNHIVACKGKGYENETAPLDVFLTNTIEPIAIKLPNSYVLEPIEAGTIAYFARGALKIENQNIIINTPITSLVNQKTMFNRNTVASSQKISYLFNDALEAIGNGITVTEVNNVFRFITENIDSNRLFSDNVIRFTNNSAIMQWIYIHSAATVTASGRLTTINNVIHLDDTQFTNYTAQIFAAIPTPAFIFVDVSGCRVNNLAGSQMSFQDAFPWINGISIDYINYGTA